MLNIDQQTFNEIDMTATATRSDGQEVEVVGHYEPTLVWYDKTNSCHIDRNSWQWTNY